MSHLTDKEQKVKEVVERFDEEIYRKGNIDAADELVSEDFRHHAPFPTPQGREGFKQFLAQFRQAFPDVTSTTEDVIVDGDKAAIRYTARGTHRGDFMDIPPTGREIAVQGISVYRVADGKVTDEWAQPDIVGMMQQMGVAPEPA